MEAEQQALADAALAEFAAAYGLDAAGGQGGRGRGPGAAAARANEMGPEKQG